MEFFRVGLLMWLLKKLFISLYIFVFSTPIMGLKPTILRSGVTGSSDWTSQAPQCGFLTIMHLRFIHVECITSYSFLLLNSISSYGWTTACWEVFFYSILYDLTTVQLLWYPLLVLSAAPGSHHRSLNNPLGLGLTSLSSPFSTEPPCKLVKSYNFLLRKSQQFLTTLKEKLKLTAWHLRLPMNS